ncbi:hypothetical protein LINPERHAP1_LOCUS36917, partial [Linum perenne]
MSTARLAQLVERKALNLVVVGSSPTVGVCFFILNFSSRFEPWRVSLSLHFGKEVVACRSR